MNIQQGSPGQQPKYEGFEVSVVRLDEEHILFGVPTSTGPKRHITHTVDETVELFRSYLRQLMAQQEPSGSGGQTAEEWEQKFKQEKKSKETN